MKNAKEQLQKQQKDKAKPKQKSAAKKMKQMSQKMAEQMQSGDMEQMEEDVVMLRQILDNLLAYSFSQEDVMKQFKNLKRGAPSFNKNLQEALKSVDNLSLEDQSFLFNVLRERLTQSHNANLQGSRVASDRKIYALAVS